MFEMPPFRYSNILQVFTPKAAALFVATGVGLFFYFRYEKQQLAEKRRACLSFSHSARLTLRSVCNP